MFTVLTIAVLALVASFAVFCRRSPRGEEDAAGFHTAEHAATRDSEGDPKGVHLFRRVVKLAKTRTRD